MSSPKRIIVIGGGIVGLCSAYYLAKAGHEVAVLERRGNVAEEASFGQPGLISPGCIATQAMPAVPKGRLSTLFGRESSVILKSAADRGARRWIRQWMTESASERRRWHTEALHRLARFSQQAIRDFEDLHQPEFEQSEGAMLLYRTDEQWEDAQAAAEVAEAAGVGLRRLDPEGARALEPGMSSHVPLAGALYAPDDLSGNCVLFAKQLKQIAQSLGVQFHFGSPVAAIEPGLSGTGIGVRVGSDSFEVDGVVVAAGTGSVELLAPLGVKLPLQGIKGYTATAAIRDFDGAPHGSVVDAGLQVAISRMGTRIRISGVIEPGARDKEIHAKALRILTEVAGEWFPSATNYNSATFWAGFRPMLPEGVPVVGATRIPNLYVNTGHGAAGWSLAAGSGLLLAERLSGRIPALDDTAYLPGRYG